MTAAEYVVLVDENNQPVGQELKSAVHTKDTPLHRGFSLFLFNPQGQLLLQQRSSHKVTWPLVWSNSCCGHPAEHESSVEAAQRRLKVELSITEAEVWEVISDYRYRAERFGVVENEICPILVGVSEQLPQPQPEEVEAIRWISWEDWLTEVRFKPHDYSEWCVEETELLEGDERFREWKR